MRYGDIYGEYYVIFKESHDTVIITHLTKLFTDIRAVICKDGRLYAGNHYLAPTGKNKFEN